MTRLCSFLLAVLVLGTMPSLARADEETARAHFKKGVDLYDRKQYAEALESFKAAYAEKQSAGIKQNIALCLKGLGRTVEAAASLDEALDEGQSTLKPETKAAIERELAELTKSVATVHLRVVGVDSQPLETAIVSVDGTPLAKGAHRRPIRLQQGIHTFTAHVEGLADPPPKKLALLLGQPVDATFIVTRSSGGATSGESTLTIRTNVDDAVIKIDGNEVGKGTWTGKLPEGSHQLEVSAPEHRTATIDVTVPGATTMEYPIQLTRIGDPPGPYDHVERKPPAPQKLYIAPSIGVYAVSYRLAEPLGEVPSGGRRPFAGASIGVRGGYRFSRWISGELFAEGGFLAARYKVSPSDPRETETGMAMWRLMPIVRLTTPGKVRFVAGTGFGLGGVQIEAKLGQGPNVVEQTGSGIGLSWLIDGGMQFDAGPLFMEGVLFFDVHGTGAVKDAEDERRYLQASPAVRGGLRIGLGIPF
jgi:hypothetical protein